MAPMISIRGLGKKYEIQSGQRVPYRTLRDAITQGFHRRKSAAPPEEFWALKDVTLDIEAGEVAGIIGRNGAGKSTLLKVLSRVTAPTAGTARLRGRVGSLLEVGTGFHPELTGHENMFLSGAVLGMTRNDIRRKYDEIVSFSGVEKFLQVPVKRYSSGMKMRLAFAVAAHLEPEILLVDEVLAVGDAEFQKKCIGKMDEISKKSGRTVLFVSHQMAAIQNLCRKGFVLDKGRLVHQGGTREAIAWYLKMTESLAEVSLADRTDRQGSGDVRFTGVSFRNGAGEPAAAFHCGEDAFLSLSFENRAKEPGTLQVCLGLDDNGGSRIAFLSTITRGQDFSQVFPGKSSIEIRLPKLALAPGRYGFTLFALYNGVTADWIQSASVFEVESGDFYGTGKLPPADQGPLLLEYDFRLAGR